MNSSVLSEEESYLVFPSKLALRLAEGIQLENSCLALLPLEFS